MDPTSLDRPRRQVASHRTDHDHQPASVTIRPRSPSASRSDRLGVGGEAGGRGVRGKDKVVVVAVALAVALARHHDPAVGVPLRGPKQAQQLRHGQVGRPTGAVPAVALTGYASERDRARVLAAGYQLHVAKPVEPDELAAVVAFLSSPAAGYVTGTSIPVDGGRTGSL